MKKIFLLFCLPLALRAQTAVNLPEVTVYSPRVANQSPAGTFAMPVSALRFEPQVDLEARNLAEGQADVTIRGGTFESTGFRIGAFTLLDPQTGHYLAEIPVAPAMFGVPRILTGADLALDTANATAGAVDYAWRPIRTAGAASVGFGEHELARGELYQGFVAPADFAGQKVGADFAVARSRSDGPIAYGEHRFDRIDGRVQLAGPSSQTDFFAGYQAKFFGWPNLYTPFNSDETENLETSLFAVNHRTDLGGGDFVELGGYQRRNKDDYAFNRFAPVGAVHPFQHTTWISGGALGGRRDVGLFALNFHGEVSTDDLKSTSLTAGRYHTRVLSKVALVPEKTWKAADGTQTTLKLGGSYDDSNRDGGTFSPIFELARAFPSAALRRIHLSYAKSSEMPSYTALNSSATSGLFRGNPNLGREISHNVELGASGTLAGWTGQATIFWRRDDSLVDWTFKRGVTARSASAVDIDTAGFEAVARRTWGACDLVLGYTLLTKDADYRGAAVDASFYALNYARQRLTAAITARLGHGFELRMDNVARVQADNLLRVTGGDNAVISSLALAYRSESLRGLELTLQADNLWNSHFQEVPAVPAAGREISGGVTYAW
ncbi:MAG TPA: TonB-dependent receptor [Opitutaceae bacterium]|nr:TonB-dependent receptor [Opitutaceae bacterium]